MYLKLRYAASKQAGELVRNISNKVQYISYCLRLLEKQKSNVLVKCIFKPYFIGKVKVKFYFTKSRSMKIFLPSSLRLFFFFSKSLESLKYFFLCCKLFLFSMDSIDLNNLQCSLESCPSVCY